MSYLPPANPYASQPPAFPPQAGLGGQQGGFPSANPFGMPPQANPMAALQGLQGGGFPGAAGPQMDPMAALQGMGGMPGATDSFTSAQAAGAQQPGMAPQGQQAAGVFQHQSGGFADKNTTLSSGGSFWTSGKGIAAISGGLLTSAWLLNGMIRHQWNPLQFWKSGKAEETKAADAITASFKDIQDKVGNGLTNVKSEFNDKIAGLVKENKTDKIKELADKHQPNVKAFVDHAKGYNGVAKLTDDQVTALTKYQTAQDELFEAAQKGDLGDKLTEANKAYDAIKDFPEALKKNIAKAGFEKRQPVSELLDSLKGKTKADEVKTAIKDKEASVDDYANGLKELLESDADKDKKTVVESLKSKFKAFTEAADDQVPNTFGEFKTAFDNVDTKIIKGHDLHQTGAKEALTSEAEGIINRAKGLEAGDQFGEASKGVLKEFSTLAAKASQTLKNHKGIKPLQTELEAFLKDSKNLSDDAAKTKLDAAIAAAKEANLGG